MGKRLIIYTATFIVAFAILFASILQSSSVHYAFSQSPSEIPVNLPEIDYQLPGTGWVGPDDPLWPLEVLRDKVLLQTAADDEDKVKKLLLLADKRIAYAQQLTHRQDYARALEVSRKAEMYLSDAYSHLLQSGKESPEFTDLLTTISSSSLEHREVLEEMYAVAPDDARPLIAHLIDTPKAIYEYTTHGMNELGVPLVENPFLTY